MGWPLSYTLETVTTDEMNMWEEYWSEELNRPGIAEYYAMGIMAEIRRPNVKVPSAVKIEDMRIKFVEKKQGTIQTGFTQEQLTEINKQRWFGALGGPPEQPRTTARSRLQKKIRPNQ